MVPSVIIIIPLMFAGAPCHPSYDMLLFLPSSLMSAVLLCKLLSAIWKICAFISMGHQRVFVRGCPYELLYMPPNFL
jgi:hypothetical protein